MDLLTILVTGFVVIMLFVGVKFQKYSSSKPVPKSVIIIIKDK